MPLTRDFKQTVEARITADRTYREEVLCEGIECLLAGDRSTAVQTLEGILRSQDVQILALRTSMLSQEKEVLRARCEIR